MAINQDAPKFAVLGTGNSGQAFAADIALKGYSVNLAEIGGFEETLKAIEKKGGIELSGKSSTGFAELNMITTDLAAAVKGVDIIIIGGSAHAHEPFSRAVAPYFEDGQFIVFTSNFAALRFKKWIKEIPITADVTPVETLSLLYATRALEPGKVFIKSVKGNLPVAALPAGRTQAFLDKITPLFPQMVPADNALVTSLNNLNPIVSIVCQKLPEGSTLNNRDLLQLCIAMQAIDQLPFYRWLIFHHLRSHFQILYSCKALNLLNLPEDKFRLLPPCS